MPGKRALAAALVCLTSCAPACGSSSGPTAPSETPHTPAVVAPPTEPVVSMAGTWVGTIDSSNFAPQPITLIAVQSANCVDGAWRSDDGRWLGAISGLATGDAYVGQISLVPADDRERCEGVANVDGPITATSLRWTAAALETRGTCQRELPRGLVITLRKR